MKIKTLSYQDGHPDIKNIRKQVFQEEQGVSPDLEFDGKDEEATHLLAYNNGEAVGTARIRKIDAKTAKIERLAVLKAARGQKIGTQLMKTALQQAQHQGVSQVLIHAQHYIYKLYETLGYTPVGEPFEEAGLLHIKMVYSFGESGVGSRESGVGSRESGVGSRESGDRGDGGDGGDGGVGGEQRTNN